MTGMIACGDTFGDKLTLCLGMTSLKENIYPNEFTKWACVPPAGLTVLMNTVCAKTARQHKEFWDQTYPSEIETIKKEVIHENPRKVYENDTRVSY